MTARKKAKPSQRSSTSIPRRPAKASAPPARGLQEQKDPAVDDYLAEVGPGSRALLQKLRKTIHAIVPQVEECISYRMPAFRYEGRIIAGFAATSAGCSYYPFSGRTLKTLRSEIDGYSRTKSALHFAKPLPTPLVRKLLRVRIAEGEHP